MTLSVYQRRVAAVLVAALCAFAVFVTFAVQAGAASDIRLKELNVGFLGSGMSPMLIVSGTLPDSVTLPAEVEVAVPEGATVAWFGELAGTGNHADDPQREYELDRTEDGWDIYRSTVTEFRSFQIEASVSPVFTETGDGSATGTVRYVPVMSAETAFVGVEVPAGSTPTSTAGFTLLGQGLNGEVWGQPVTPFEAGQEATFEFAYGPGGSGPGSASDGNTSTVITILVVGAVAILMGLVGYAVYRRMGAS